MIKQNTQRLAGKVIAVTRSGDQAGSLAEKLETEGAEVLCLPLIRVEAAVDTLTFGDVCQTLAIYEWLVFTSPNGVRFFMEAFCTAFDDIRALGPARIACVGKSTARAFEPYHLRVDLVPDNAQGEDLAKALVETDSLDSAKVLVVTGSRNRDVVPKILEKEGRAIVDALQVYRTEFADLSDCADAQTFRQAGADAITFTSSSTAESFVAQAGQLALEHGAKQPKTVSIGPVTSETMRKKHLPVHTEAKEANLDALVEAVVRVLA